LLVRKEVAAVSSMEAFQRVPVLALQVVVPMALVVASIPNLIVGEEC
jgi:hypothetical protein